MVLEGESHEYRELPITVEQRRNVVERAYDSILQEYGSRSFTLFSSELGRVKCILIPVDLNHDISMQLTECSGTTYTFDVFIPLHADGPVNRMSPVIIRRQITFSPDAFSSRSDVEAPPVIESQQTELSTIEKMKKMITDLHGLIHDLFIKNTHVL